jgi:hypothetical protein
MSAFACACAGAGEPNTFEIKGIPAEATPNFTKDRRLNFDEPIV